MSGFMQGEINCFPDSDVLCRSVAEHFLLLSRRFITSQGQFSVALSGGKTPKRLYQLLAQHCRENERLEGIRFYFGDERHVPMNHGDSNYNMLNNELFIPCHISQDHVNPIPTECDPSSSAALYAQTLLASLPIHDGLPKFDLVLLGMGTDGHTASLFSLDSIHDDRMVVATHVDKLDAWRISMNYKLLNNADNVWVLVTGADKTEMFSQLLSGTADALPIATIEPRGEMIWYVDQDAYPDCIPSASARQKDSGPLGI